MEDTYSAAEAATELGLHPNTVLRWLGQPTSKEAKFPAATKVGRFWEIPAKDVEALKLNISKELERSNRWHNAADVLAEFRNDAQYNALADLHVTTGALYEWLEELAGKLRLNLKPNADRQFMKRYAPLIRSQKRVLARIDLAEQMNNVVKRIRAESDHALARADRRLDFDYDGPHSEIE